MQTLNVSGCKKLVRFQLKCSNLSTLNFSLCGMPISPTSDYPLTVIACARIVQHLSWWVTCFTLPMFHDCDNILGYANCKLKR